jgi:hypothetical protein
MCTYTCTHTHHKCNPAAGQSALEERPFEWLVALVLLLGWIKDEASLHSFPAF